MQTKQKIDYMTRIQNGEDIYNTFRKNGDLPQRVAQHFNELIAQTLCILRIDGDHTSIQLTRKGHEYLERQAKK